MSTTSLAVRPRPVDASPDTHPGIRWWNSLPERERKAWLVMAGTACPADAWQLRNELMRGIHGRAA